MPITLTFEQLPTVAAGEEGGLAKLGDKMDLLDTIMEDV
jgi:hypothetical protein